MRPGAQPLVWKFSYERLSTRSHFEKMLFRNGQFIDLLIDWNWIRKWLFHRLSKWVNDLLIDWLTYWLINVLNNWMNYWLTDWWIDYRIDEFIIWLINCFINCSERWSYLGLWVSWCRTYCWCFTMHWNNSEAFWCKNTFF